MDTAWAIDQLREFFQVAAPTRSYRAGIEIMAEYSRQGNDAIAGRVVVVEQILDRATPLWRANVTGSAYDRWRKHREAAAQAITQLQDADELQSMLGDDAPALSAARFHPWAWDGARSMWGSGHYRQAVVNALGKVQAETQNKTGRHDLSETKLFTEVFAPSPPKTGSPRLRLRPDDGSDTYKSAHRGAMTLAEGLFAGIRNVAVHTVAETEADQQEALEQLAAVSVLARWVDASSLAVAP